MTVSDRFWAKVEKGDGCWKWTGVKDRHGYGRIFFEGRIQQAHRVSWFLAHGEEVNRSLQCCHKCDNTGCIRPDHLFVGTAKDNLDDCKAKGRYRPPMWRLRLATCKWGHPWDRDDVYRDKHGHRRCRPCLRAKDVRRYWKSKKRRERSR